MTVENRQVGFNPNTDPVRRMDRWSDIKMFARLSGFLIASSIFYPVVIPATIISLMATADLYRSYDRDYLSPKPTRSLKNKSTISPSPL